MSSGAPAKKKKRGMDKEVIMDTSEQYIKMCEKAEEIQAGHKLTEGDWVDFWDGQGCVGHWEEGEHFHNGKAHTWLPRQDQLQEMILEIISTLVREVRLPHLAWRFDKFCSPNVIHPFYKNYNVDMFTSMEQLWLAFVMKEKYNKVWNGEDWSNHAIL